MEHAQSRHLQTKLSIDTNSAEYLSPKHGNQEHPVSTNSFNSASYKAHAQSNTQLQIKLNDADITEKIRSIFKEPCLSEEDVNYLQDMFQELSFLQSFSPNDSLNEFKEGLYLLFENAKLKEFSGSSVIYKENDHLNNCFYILLSGEVNLVKKDIQPTSSITLDQNPSSQLFIPLNEEFTRRATKVFTSSPSNKKDLLFNSINSPSNRHSLFHKVQSPKASIATDASPAFNISSPMSRFRMERQDTFKAKSPNAVDKQSTHLKRLSILDLDQIEATKDGFVNHRLSRARKNLQILNKLMNTYGKVVETLSVGKCFGEDVTQKGGKRRLTAIATKKSEVIELDIGPIQKVVEALSEKREQIKKFILSILPAMDFSYCINYLETILYTLEERRMKYHDIVFREKELGEKFYVLYNGSCQIFKKVKINDTARMSHVLEDCKGIYSLRLTNTEEVNICIVGNGAILGEEILFNEDSRFEYNVRVTSASAVLLVFDRQKFLKFPQHVLLAMSKMYNMKKQHNMKILQANLTTKDVRLESGGVSNNSLLVGLSPKKSTYRPSLHTKYNSKESQEFANIVHYLRAHDEEHSLTNIIEDKSTPSNNMPRKSFNTLKPTITINENNNILAEVISNLHSYSTIKEKGVKSDDIPNSQTEFLVPDIQKLEVPGQAHQKRLSVSIRRPSSIQADRRRETLKDAKELVHLAQESNTVGEISLRLGSHPGLMKVERRYSIMKSILQTEDSKTVANRAENESGKITIYNQSVLGLIPENSVMNDTKKKYVSSQKEVPIKTEVNRPISSPKYRKSFSNVLLSPTLINKFEKTRNKSKEDDFFETKEVQNPIVVSSPITVPTPDVVLHTENILNDSLINIVTPKIKRPATTATHCSSLTAVIRHSVNERRRLVTSISNTHLSHSHQLSISPFDKIRKETEFLNRSDIKVSVNEEWKIKADNKKETGELLGSRTAKNINLRKKGSIPKRVGGFMSNSYYKINRKELNGG